MTVEVKEVKDPTGAEGIRDRDELEDRFADDLLTMLDNFLHEVLADVVDALNSPVLLAAAAADPFAYTTVQKRWSDGIARLAEGGKTPADVIDIMAHSTLPDDVYVDVLDILDQSTANKWSVAKTKLHLRNVLLPKRVEGEPESAYRSRVRGLARTSATRAFGLESMDTITDSGWSHKKWVSMVDSRTRDSHQAAHGQTVPVGTDFTINGMPMAFPGDPRGGVAETYNCRCVILGAGEHLSAAATPSAPNTSPTTTEGTTPMRWKGILAVEDQITGDGRYISSGALRWENLPIPLRYVPVDNGSHDGALTVGLIDNIWRDDSGTIWGEGPWDTSDTAAEAMRQVEQELQHGVSVDLDDVDFELRVAQSLLEGELNIEETDEDGRVTVVKVSSDDEVMYVTSARVRAATLVSIPAFDEARIENVEDEGDLALVAAAGPVVPPMEWFDNPKLSVPTPLTITDEGHIFGHLATWDTCHISFPGACVTPPKSATDYSYFRTGAVETREGGRVAVGHITMGTGHAGSRDNREKATAHYDNTGLVAADVVVGDDSVGIWVSGAVRPNLSKDNLRALRAAPLSGDWRSVNGNLELVAALAVNTPGFPVPRPRGLVAGGDLVALVASGMVAPRQVYADQLSEEDLRYLKRLAHREREADLSASAKELASRIKQTHEKTGYHR